MKRGALTFSGVVARGAFELTAEFVVQPGEALAVLGPNGAGKTTLLHALAGLSPLAAGRIELAGRILDEPGSDRFVPAHDRRVGYIFQDYRLFPHLSVRGNLEFALRASGSHRAQVRTESSAGLRRFGLLDLAERRPHQLSGGEQQRAAVARALVTTPDLLLLDEPMAALDSRTQVMVQAELRSLLADFGGPVVIVTHDPLEALLLADRLLILEGGRVVQAGSPADVTRRPATDYVARLVGLNLYQGVFDGTAVQLADGGRLVVPTGPALGPVLVALRPTAITVGRNRPEPTSARNSWPATVTGLAMLSDRVRLELAGEPSALADVTPAAVADLDLHPGTEVWLTVKATELEVYAGHGTTGAAPDS